MVDDLAHDIGKALGTSLRPEPTTQVQGGSISASYRWDGTHGPVFVKVAAPENAAAFAAEAAGLEELRLADAVRVPRVLGVGTSASGSWIALEWLAFGASSARSESLLGEQLARQHRVTRASFGWSRDNTIGSTPQLNGWMSDWVEFFRERRLRLQLELAVHHGHGSRLQRRGGELLERMTVFFTSYRPVPSLLHGDLWSGNWAADRHGDPVIFDPAVYYGDREADLAMTRLFGGFGREFHAAYQRAWPLDPGSRTRIGLYNLYHVLNHLNLFGGGYGSQALAMIDALLAQAGH